MADAANPLGTENARLREALTWAVGFIRCNFPHTVAPYPDYRNACDLLAEVGQVITGEFTMTRYRAEQAEDERDRLKAAIAKHHDQYADDLCVLDDDELYAAAGLPPRDNTVGDPEAMLENCKRFIRTRCAGGGAWKSYADLEAENARLRAALLVAHGTAPAATNQENA